MKKVFFIVLASFLLIFQSANANVVVNGTDVGETINVNGTVYVPLDSIAEGFNSSVTWKGNTAYLENSSDAMVTHIVKEASDFTVGIIGKYSSGGQEGISYGSGFVIDENGIIMTNAHVVTGLKTILVVMNDGRTFEGKVKNIDANADVALVKINCTGLKAAKFADSSTVQVGQTVIAIGTPISFSLRNSATMGIISGLNRSTSNSYRLLQSDAVLNKGNSGGPLINLKGEVVGMGTQGIVGVTGIFFSVTADTMRYAIEHFEKYGRIRKPKLGVTLTEGWLSVYDLPSDEGLTIKTIEEGSPAQKAGLIVNDSILGTEDFSISTVIDFNEAMKKYLPGDTVNFKIKRGNSIITVPVVMG